MKTITLTNDPLTGLQRKLIFKSLNADDNQKLLTIFWRLSIIRLDGSESSDSRDYQQKADNNVRVNMEVFAATGQIEFLIETQEGIPVPENMGEYDFWWWVTDHYPSGMTQQLINAGTEFSVKNGWL